MALRPKEMRRFACPCFSFVRLLSSMKGTSRTRNIGSWGHCCGIFLNLTSQSRLSFSVWLEGDPPSVRAFFNEPVSKSPICQEATRLGELPTCLITWRNPLPSEREIHLKSHCKPFAHGIGTDTYGRQRAIGTSLLIITLDMFATDLADEKQAIEFYTQASVKASAENDIGTRQLFERIKPAAGLFSFNP